MLETFPIQIDLAHRRRLKKQKSMPASSVTSGELPIVEYQNGSDY